jgi:hypothetical protein
MPDRRGGQAEFVLKLLSDERPNLVLGDSHIGQRDRLGDDYLFLGRPGATTFELLQALQVYLRNKNPGRIILEAGPQLFAGDRQGNWRTFNKDSFRSQLLPFSLYIFEPELVKAFPSIMGFDDVTAYRYQLISRAKRLPKTIAHARMRADRLTKAQRRLSTVKDVPIGVRRALATYRYRSQLPVTAFRDSAAWSYFEALLDLLKARGAEVCLLRMPVSPTYREILAAEPGAGRVRAAVGELRAKAGVRGMRFVDFSETQPDLPALYFKNQDHLNDLGHRLFWPIAEKACFGHSESAGDSRRLPRPYHLLNLRNAGFEADLGRDGDGTPRCPPGWLWRGPLPLERLQRFDVAVADSPFRSKRSYGVRHDGGSDEGGGRQWWSLGKRFQAQGGARIEVSVKVRSEGLEAAVDRAADSQGRVFLEDNDAYIEVAALDGDGELLPLSRETRYSQPLSAQAAAADRQGLASPPWYSLSHRATLPAGTRQIRLWLTAVSGRGMYWQAGWRGGAPQLLFDDFEMLSSGPLKEVKLAERRARREAEQGGSARGRCGPSVRQTTIEHTAENHR